MSDVHRLNPTQTIILSDLPTTSQQYHDNRDSAEDEFRMLRNELIEYQRRLYADGSMKFAVPTWMAHAPAMRNSSAPTQRNEKPLGRSHSGSVVPTTAGRTEAVQ